MCQKLRNPLIPWYAPTYPAYAALSEKKMERTIDVNNVVKIGTQDPDDPLKYILSTDVLDRIGDIVEQDWKLKDFKKNPIALFMHDHKSPIGTWSKVGMESGKLVGTLKLAKEGTSAVIDTVRALISQRILKAVSVGFSVGGYEAMYDENDNFKGYRLKNPDLHEASIVSVGANQEALQIAKSFNLSENDITGLFLPVEKKIETDLLQKQKNRMTLLNLGAR